MGEFKVRTVDPEELRMEDKDTYSWVWDSQEDLIWDKHLSTAGPVIVGCLANFHKIFPLLEAHANHYCLFHSFVIFASHTDNYSIQNCKQG